MTHRRQTVFRALLLAGATALLAPLPLLILLLAFDALYTPAGVVLITAMVTSFLVVYTLQWHNESLAQHVNKGDDCGRTGTG